MRKFLSVILSCIVINSTAQTFEWWARLVHWDGLSEWPRYMITEPGYMGPNALPVPRIGNGSIDSTSSFATTGSFHFSNGDNTQNITVYANYCLVKNRISFDASWIPYEHFTMSHAMKERRHVFSYFYYDEQATGDIHLNTNIQLLNRREEAGEPVADIRVKSARLHGVAIGPDLIPQTIDEFPVLCVAAAVAEGETIISGAEELRVKESDRIATVSAELRAMGAQITENGCAGTWHSRRQWSIAGCPWPQPWRSSGGDVFGHRGLDRSGSNCD